MQQVEKLTKTLVKKEVGPKKRLNPLNDFLFKQYMGTEECKICLLSFLNAVLEENISDVEILENLELPQETLEGKFGRLDVRANLLDGTQINIEVQLLNEDNIIKRSQYYNGRLYVSGIGKGDDYNLLTKVISINILNFNYFPYVDFHISGHIRVDQYPQDLLSDDQEWHFLELKKFYKSKEYDRRNSLHRWLKYFDRNLEEDELKELIQMDGAIKMAEEKTKKVSSNEKEMRYYEAIEDARRNMVSSMRYQWEQGKEQGIEQGIEQGEERLAELMKRLFLDNRIEEAQKVTVDLALRKELYKEYGV